MKVRISKHSPGCFDQRSVLPFSNSILLRLKWSTELMLNSLAQAVNCHCLVFEFRSVVTSDLLNPCSELIFYSVKEFHENLRSLILCLQKEHPGESRIVISDH